MTATHQSAEKPVYYPWLDCIRGTAVLLVLFYHNFSFLSWSAYGYLGVDIFFVLSGFLITNILCTGNSNTSLLKNFYARRILRIFPVYFAALLFVFFIYPALTQPVYNQYYFLEHQYWFYFFLQNWLYIIHPLEKTGILNHLWSIAVEEQFYLIWPLLFVCFGRRRSLTTLLAITIAILPLLRSILYLRGYKQAPLYTFSRFDGIPAGCIIALLKSYMPQLAKRFFLVSCIFLFSLHAIYVLAIRHTAIPYFPCIGYTTVSIAAAWLVFWVCNKPQKQLLAVRLLSYTGKISYGLYIYHWIFFTLLSSLTGKYLAQYLMMAPRNVTLVSSLLISGLAYAFSIVSFNHYESIFRSLKKYFVVYNW